MILAKFVSISRNSIRTQLNTWLSINTSILNTQQRTLSTIKMAKQINDESKFTAVRLPTSVRPCHYDLKLTPNFTDFTYDGQVTIQYESSGGELPNSIVLHANEIKISDGSLDNGSPLTTVTYSKETETATLEFGGPIGPKGSIDLKFTGTLNDKMKGFYRTAFKLDDTTVHAATTQFEATDARRCFPCWDEPAIKATFSVSLVIDQFMVVKDKKYERLVLSNMPEISRSNVGSQVEVKFDKSPIMSTYLLAFIVGPFEFIEGDCKNRPIRIYTTPGKKEQGRFALDAACKSLAFYEEYFGVEYPLPKMDLIAIPDFASGAMENWGLVTYRETCLLVDENSTATNTRQWVALVVAHELAHQWFGNLVTMEWWTHLWLNEGFASFMEYLCVNRIFPEYDIWSQFVTDAYGRAMDLDSLHNSHPIEVPVNHPSEIDEIFDVISYSKGASVIRMLYCFIGDDNFRKGMKDYLTKFAYKNAATEDLWDCLEAASNKPIRQLMSGWTAQKGYPWLSVSYSKDGNDAKLMITQNKFSSNGKVPDDEAAMIWWIPINVVSGTDPSELRDICIFSSKSTEITVLGAGDHWVKLNPSTIGLYRTAYPKEMVEKLWPAISAKTLRPMDRLGLQNDFFALCQAGNVSTVELLKLLQAFKGEDVYTVWNSIDSSLGRLSILLSNTDYKEKLHAFGRELYREIFKQITWCSKPEEHHNQALLRSLIINRLVSFGDKDVIEEAKAKYKAHLDGTKLVPADLRSAVYRSVAAYGDETSFESLFNLYRTAELHEEKDRAARALGFTRDEVRLNRVIDFALSDEVRNQDKIFFIIPIGVNKPAVAWKLLKDNKDMLREKYETGHLMTRLIKYTTENFASEEMAQEIEQFFKDNKFPGAERTVQQSLETIRLNVEWLARDGEKMREFLSSY